MSGSRNGSSIPAGRGSGKVLPSAGHTGPRPHWSWTSAHYRSYAVDQRGSHFCSGWALSIW